MPKIKEIAEKQEEYLQVLEKRNLLWLIPKVKEGISFYQKWKEAMKELDNLRHERNLLSIEYSKTKDEKIREKVTKLKEKINQIEESTRKLEEKIKKIELLLPNWLYEDVPIGPDESFNKPIKYVGKPLVMKKFEAEFRQNFPGVEYKTTEHELLHHYNLIKVFDLADVDTAARIAGSRFYIEKNQLVTLDLALTLFTLQEFMKLGFKPIIPPYLMKKSVEEKITYFEVFQDAIYELEKEGLILITTSEHPLAAMFADKVFSKDELPIRIVAFSPAFRREAGAHGKDTKGIFRVHQFHKVELHSITTLEEERKELDFLVAIVEKVMRQLNFPYRIIANSSGDMDKRAKIQFDLEAWFPAQNRYRELHSFATMGSWVSEKINTRVEVKGQRKWVANLYATGAAIQRTLLAIFVNNYEPEKEIIRIPKPLEKLTGIAELASKK